MITSANLNHPPIKSHLISHDESKHTLVIEPLLPGYGHTLGNSLRRILLSSIPGYAVTRIRINEITHEYQPIQGVVEDALDVILNLKLIRAKIKTDDEKVVVTINKNAEGEVTAGDFANNKVEIFNPDQYICYLNKDAKLTIEIEVSRGVGYLSVDQINLAENTNPQDIYVDALFSPVTNTALEVEQVRVGDKTNFDKLEISFETDRSIEASEVVEFILSLTIDLFSKILSSFQASLGAQPTVAPKETASKDPSAEKVDSGADDSINLPTRIKNILEKNGISTNSELINRIDDIEEFAGITEKALGTIKDYIKTIS